MLCDTCQIALNEEVSIEEARLEVEDLAAGMTPHLARADGLRCTCGTVDHVLGRGIGGELASIHYDVRHKSGCPLAPPDFDWPPVDEDARRRIFGYEGREHHARRLVGALREVLHEREVLET